GDAGADRLFGGTGAAYNSPRQGAAGGEAGNGNDQVETAFDAIKTLDGGNGRDMLMAFYDGAATDSLSFNLRTGNFNSTDANIDGSTAVNFERFSFNGDIDAKITGTDGANEIVGGFGNDRLVGKGGKDVLYGDEGDDTLLGNKKADTLDGGLGDDLLIGGSGTDTFDFSGGTDTIADFKDDVDTIRIYARLLEEGTTVADLIDSATVVDGNTVIEIDADNVLTIEGLGDPSLLSDDLVIL
ncbi:MAG: hypothetical protein P1U75_04565, partial [Antarcticimicrobium sp.]|nr:hypothetical protein [Antarcticimicrobium sp.]